jgi:small conductance mechanosensitive channel
MQTFIQSILNQLQTYFDPEALGAGIADLLLNALVALVIFAAYYLAWWILQHLIQPVLRRSNIEETIQVFLETILKYTVLIIGALNALSAIGVNTGALAASLGIAGLTIGFAARDALSNLISGILIFIDRPFVIGDLVEIENQYGRVSQITLRSTRIVTVDGKMLAVPNSQIINQTVASYTNFPNLRLDIPVTIAVSEDIERARQALLDLVTDKPEYLQTPAPRVVVTQLNDYNVALELQVWLEKEREHIEKRFELRERIFTELTRSGIDMPFETFQFQPVEVKLAGRPDQLAQGAG